MKKYLLSIAALLLGLLAHSQEADDLGKYAEVSIIPSLDLNSSWSSEGFEFGLGNSSLYTHFEGSASEHFSWTLINHWFSGNDFLGADPDPFSLFKGLGWSNTTNFIDMLYFDLTFGSWTFTLGKQCITTGGHEYDDYDWDVHTQLSSPLWDGLACYQWGGKVAWTTPSEMTTFSLQMTTSPFGERPFSSGLWTWSAQWSGEYGWYSPLWSVSAFSRYNDGVASASHQYSWLVSLGNQFLLGNWTITVDWTNIAGFNEMSDGFQPGHLFHGSVAWAPSERWECSLRGNLVLDAAMGNGWNAGAILHFFPLRDSQALRLHLLASYDPSFSQFMIAAGIRYNLNIKLW